MIVIVDYGMSNLRSVAKAFEAAGASQITISHKKHDIEKADKLVLPGQGGFPDGMHNLIKHNLIEPIKKHTLLKRKPLLGICLGMQILADVSFEFHKTNGLGFVKGTVRQLKTGSGRHRIPHVGWDDIRITKPCPILTGVPRTADFYFVHSFIFKPTEQSVVSAVCDYAEVFPAVIWKENIFATLFHPEKSQSNGLRIIKNFYLL